MKNQCDEEFRLVQYFVKDTIHDLLKFLIRDKFPFKSEGDSIRMIEEIQNGVIKDYFWKKIIEKMYDEKDIIVIK